jgi:hypothetical protein
MRIGHCYLCWTPKGEHHAPPKGHHRDDQRGKHDKRGQVDIYSAGTPESAMRSHPNRAGVVDTRLPDTRIPGGKAKGFYASDPRAHDPDPKVRAAYAQEIARLMIERDGLDAVLVDRFLRTNVDEYRELWPSVSEATRHGE